MKRFRLNIFELFCIATCVSIIILCFFFYSIAEPKENFSRAKVEHTDDFKLGRNGNIKDAYLVVLIISNYKGYEQRKAIRNTWLKNLRATPHIRYLFVVGQKNILNDNNVKPTDLNYDDILLVDTEDNYTSLTKKVLRSFEFLNRHWKFQYIFKCDDDSFARVLDIYNELRNMDIPNLYWGFFNGAATVKKRGKWKEQNWLLCDHYIPYALGGGYILSKMLVNLIANNAPYLRLYDSEDVSVGSWLAPFNVTRYHDPRFDTEYRSRGCFNIYLVTHKKTVADMYDLQHTLDTFGKLCLNEYRVSLSYNYDWNVPPSKCCNRFNTSIP